MSDPTKALSGVEGLDDVLGGGLVARKLHLVEGRPGTGKTTIGLQFLMAGRDAGERTAYLTMSESPEEFAVVANSHGWAFDGIDICDVVPADFLAEEPNRQTMFHTSEVELGETMRMMLEAIARINPKRVVIDSLSEMRLLAQDPLRYRRQIFALKQFFSKRDATVLLLDDMTSERHDLQLHSIAHGVVTLEQLPREYGGERRRVMVTKLRGVRFRGGYHDYMIRTGGVEIFPRLIAAEHPGELPSAVASSGSPGLDAMLGGGLRRGTSALLIGPAGSGKSSIALTIAYAAAKRGEHVSMFAFDEGVPSICERALGLDKELVPLIKSGVVHLQQVNPTEMSPGEFTSTVRREVARGARVVVIDSLNGYLHAMPNERHLTLELHELLSFLSQAGVLTILVMAQHGLIAAMQPPVDVSYLSDSVLLLRFFEARGRIRKAISVLKKRVGAHEDTIREFKLSGRGLEVGEPLTDFQGVMSGVPSYAGDQPLLTHDGEAG